MITIEEGNKLIAEFMKEKVSDLTILKSDGFSEFMKYHFDWNELMKVVQKLYEPYKFKIIDEVDTNEWYISRRLFDLSITSSILEVWNAVVNFIIWYNEKNKS